jgi:phage gpG-like protein
MPSPGGRGDLAVRVEGLADLRRALGKVDKTLARGMARVLRQTGKLIVSRARANAPVDDGDLRRSIKQSVTAKRATIYSNAPYAAVHEYGGTIRPHGGPVHIAKREFLGRAVGESRREIDAALDDLLDDIADTWAG